MKKTDYQPRYCPMCKDVYFTKLEQLMQHMKEKHQSRFEFREYDRE